MMKFFRRHTKHLVAIFMALLLIVWLLDDFLRDLGRDGGRGDIEWGQVYGQKVAGEGIQGVQRETEILNQLGVPWNRFWLLGPTGQMMYLARSKPLSLREWYMLGAEARRLGVYVPQGQVESMRANLPPEGLEHVRKSLKASIADIDKALESFQRIQRAFFISELNATVASEAEIQEHVRELEEKARVRLAVLEASQFVDAGYQPTPAEMQAQFDRYKDRDKLPGFGEESVGYRFPEEAMIEYIAVHADAVSEKQQINLDEAHEFWSANKNQFNRPTTQPATRPVPYDNFTDALPEVRKRMQRDKARRETLSIAAEIAQALRADWVNQPATQPGGFKEPPASAVDPQLYSRTVDEFRKRYGDVLTFERSGFHSLEDFGRGVFSQAANARALGGTPQQIQLKEAAFLVQGLEADRAQRPDHAAFFHNLFETVAEPFVDNAGNAYVFRTVAVRPKHSPASYDEVKEAVAADVRLRKAAETAKQKAEELAESAKRVGLEPAIIEDPVLREKLGVAGVATPPPFARRQPSFMGQTYPSSVSPVGSDAKFIETVFAMSGTTATQPARVALYAPEGEKRWIVVELVDFIPLTQDEYVKLRERHGLNLLGARQLAFAREWLSSQGIRERVQWKAARPEEEMKELEQTEAGMLDL